MNKIIMGTLLGSVFASGVMAHGDDSAKKIGEWVTESLLVKRGDHWPIERCFNLVPGQRIQYRFESAFPVKFNLHAHPKDTAKHDTIFLDKQDNTKHFSGDHKAPRKGIYCADFAVLERQAENWNITFHYRID